MIVRAIDIDNDWTYGKGKNNYKKNEVGSPEATLQNIKTRLQEFLGDCFFALNRGVDWFNLLGAKDELALKLAIAAVILNTTDVTNVEEVSSVVSDDRTFVVNFEADTVYGSVSGSIELPLEV